MINIGSLFGQIGMTYSEKVCSSLVLSPHQPPRPVRRLLACLHPPHRNLPPVPNNPLHRAQTLHPCPAHGLRPRHIPSPIPLRRQGKLEPQPPAHLPRAHGAGLLGCRAAESCQSCGAPLVDDVRRPVGGRGAARAQGVWRVCVVSCLLYVYLPQDAYIVPS